jgi:uncharacterized protein YjbJ (UPF0337 family)
LAPSADLTQQRAVAPRRNFRAAPCVLPASVVDGNASVGATRMSNLQRSETMDWDRIAGNWKQFTGKAKEQWGKLTDDELDQIQGKREQLEGKIQERYGYAKDKTREEVDAWLNRM